MTHAQHSGSGATHWIVASLAAIATLAYIAFALRQQPRWGRWRIGSFATGSAVALAAFLPQLATRAHIDLRAHMVQHLLLGMLSPILIILAEPLILLLRSIPPRLARVAVRLLRSRALRFVGHPITALVLNVGGMYVLYLTPLYAFTSASAIGHAILHIHFFAAGCLFTWSIVGLDPFARRVSLQLRLAVLFAGIATHSTLAKVMYAYEWPRGTSHSVAEIHAAAKLMYYGGDAAELLVAVAFFAVWYHRRGRMPAPSTLNIIAGPAPR